MSRSAENLWWSGRSKVSASLLRTASAITSVCAAGGDPPSVTFRTGSNDGVALTFDDGPAGGLNAFLQVLERWNARATFFLLGERVDRDSGPVREIVARGHEVAVHGYRHRSHLLLPSQAVVGDMRSARETIEQAAQCPTRCFRPPYGLFSRASWREANRQGWKRVLWSRHGWDWSPRAKPASVATLVGPPKGGDVVLLHDHDRYAPTLGALPDILGSISQRGLRAVPVAELL